MAGANTTASQMEAYNLNMLTLLKENTGGHLRAICQQHTESGTAEANFYRLNEATTTTTIDMYDTANYTGTGGLLKKVTVAMAPAYAHDKLTETEVLTTKLDLKGAYLQSFIRAVQRDEDKKIVTSILAGTNTNVAMTGALSVKANLLKFVSLLKKSVVSVEMSPDRAQAPVCIVAMHIDNYAELFESEFWINSDYNMINGMGNGDNSFNVQFVKYKGTSVLAKGKVLIIPSQTVGYADWGADGMRATMDYHHGDDKWWLSAKHSMASKVIDDNEITVITMS